MDPAGLVVTQCAAVSTNRSLTTTPPQNWAAYTSMPAADLLTKATIPTARSPDPPSLASGPLANTTNTAPATAVANARH